MAHGQIDCAGCGETWASKPSCIYLFETPIPSITLLKFGFSSTPPRRLCDQLGKAARDHGSILHVIDMPTGNAALKEEKRGHRSMRKHHSDLVVDYAIYKDHINTKSEVYDLAAKSILLGLMDEIAVEVATIQSPPLR